MKKTGLTIAVCLCIQSIFAQSFSGWRGDNRDGIYKETGLLKSWPEEGPQLLWEATEVGKGFSSPVASGDKVFISGLDESGEKEMITAFSLDGKILWQTIYGTAWKNSYPDTRSTPSIVGTDLYIESGKPEMVCIDATTGKIKWSMDAVELYNRKPTEYGPAESPLIIGDVLYFTTMGDKASLVALDRKTGKLIWEAPPFKDDLMYASPILIEHNGKKQLVIISEAYATAFDQESGAMAWQCDIRKLVYKGMEDRSDGFKPQFTNTPIYKDGCLAIACGYDYGTLMLKLNDDATAVSQLWLNRDLDPHHGGMILMDGYLYGSTWKNNNIGGWACIDWKTGKTLYDESWKDGNKGSVIYADGKLYCYDDRRGNLALVNVDPEEFEVISQFRITKGEGAHWAHPTISNGVLYIRHGNALMAYKVK